MFLKQSPNIIPKKYGDKKTLIINKNKKTTYEFETEMYTSRKFHEMGNPIMQTSEKHNQNNWKIISH